MTKAEQHHKTQLAKMGCAVCRRIYPSHEPAGVELHHYRGGGWGRGNFETLIPLCFEHHRGDTGVHGLGTKGFDVHYTITHGFTQRDLLNDTLERIEHAKS